MFIEYKHLNLVRLETPTFRLPTGGGGHGIPWLRPKEALAPNRHQIFPVPLYIGTYSVLRPISCELFRWIALKMRPGRSKMRKHKILPPY